MYALLNMCILCIYCKFYNYMYIRIHDAHVIYDTHGYYIHTIHGTHVIFEYAS